MSSSLVVALAFRLGKTLTRPYFLTLLALLATASSAPAALVHQWTFDDGTANDSVGTNHGALYNGATVSGGQLRLDGVNDYFRTSPLAQTLSNRTLMVWVMLSNLTQRAGSALTLENPNGNDVFDGIIYGEQVTNRWINGSDNALRWNTTAGTTASPQETSLAQVSIAIVYGDPTTATNNIKIYRNGVLYADYTPASPLINYAAGVADVLIGVRHSDRAGDTGTATGTDAFLAGSIDEARIYDTALTASQIADVRNLPITVNNSAAWLGFMNVSDLPADGGAYRFGSAWATNDLSAVFNAPQLLTLTPNTSIDRDSPNDPYWWKAPGNNPNKILGAVMYVQDDSLAGSTVNFTGYCLSNSLVAPYTSVAFIRDFAPDYSSFTEVIAPLVGRSIFNLAKSTTPGNHIQYGFETVGPNARLTNAPSLGRVLVTSISAGLPVVLNTKDSGPGSLRQTIADAVSGATITFAPALSGQTITLTNGQLLIAKNLTIDASVLPGGITLHGNHASRIFQVNDGVALVLDHLTLTGGSADFGGGILNGGTLTINSSTLSGNSAGIDGGGIQTWFEALTIINNSTLSGNSAGSYGGGIENLGRLTINNSTVAGNSAGTGGGGIDDLGTSFEMYNSIVANNTNENLNGFPLGNGNLTSGDPRLAPLGQYGGPTKTMPPLPGSPAIDAGWNFGNLPATDQRGFARVVGPAPDIGAVEATLGEAYPIVTTTADAGAGSLRQVLAEVFPGSTITFAPALSGQTITLTNGQLLIAKNLTIDASALPGGVTVSGNNSSRIFECASGTTNTLTALAIVQGNALGGFLPNFGGGIFNQARLTLNRCMLVNNSAGIAGGGIYNEGPLTLNNCTLAGNSSGLGGGISSSGTATLNHCTLSQNGSGHGGGIWSAGGTTLRNSIVAGNSADRGADLYDAFGGTTRVGANIIVQYGHDPRLPGDPSTGPAAITNAPLLAPLGNYGGPTQTMPPLPGSPAIDAGVATSLTTDQRGFPRGGGAAPDIGAVELQLPPSQIVYADALVNGWLDWSYNCNRNFANATPVRAGSHSLAVTVTNAYGGAQFFHPDLDSSAFTHVTFWIHGGATGGQQLQLYGLLHAGGSENQVQPQRHFLDPLPANIWRSYAVPLAALGVANATNFTGFVIQDAAGTTQPVFYLDDIKLANIPAVTLVGAATLTNECHASFSDLGATTDKSWVLIVSGNVDVDTPGTYTITYSTTNAIAGLGTATRTVVVRDTVPPVVTLLGLNPLKAFLNTPFVDPGATALDACGGSLAVTTNSTVNLAIPGTYAITYSATDNSGNTSAAMRTVEVTVPTPFPGNGVVGDFGGAIGAGSLLLTDDGATISGKITRGPGGFSDALVLYLDTQSGGFTNTAGFADAGDELRRAISGFAGVNRSTLTFLSGFAPDYVIALGPSGPNFGGIWQLTNGGDWSHVHLSSVNLAPLDNAFATTYTFSFPVTDVGLVPGSGAQFRFFGTYISTTAYRSTEALPGNVSGTQGWNPFLNTAVASYRIQGPQIVITDSPYDPATRQMRLIWMSTPGEVYALQHSTNLAMAGGGFTSLPGSINSGGLTTTNTVTLPAGPTGFVRVLRLSPP